MPSQSRSRLVGAFMVASFLSACAGDAPVTPSERVLVLEPGQPGTSRFDVLPPASTPRYEPIDIVFVFDGTGSMGGVIGAVQRSAATILDDVSTRSRNVRYAVVEFGDYPGLEGNCQNGRPADLGRPTWRLIADFTDDPETVKAGIGAVGVHWNGCDVQEAYLRALEEARSLRWRPRASRYVVLLGDAPARAPDPGRDEVLGTADDLVPAQVSAAYARDRITMIGIYASSGPHAGEAAASFSALAEPTPHGMALPLRRDGDVRDLIRRGLVEVPPPPPAMVLATTEYGPWVGAIQRRHVPADGRRYRFDTGITPPRGTPDGIYHLKFDALTTPGRPESAFGSGVVTIRIGWEYYPLVPLLLLPLLLLCAAALCLLASQARWRGQWGLFFGGTAAREFVFNLATSAAVIAAATWLYLNIPDDFHSLQSKLPTYFTR